MDKIVGVLERVKGIPVNISLGKNPTFKPAPYMWVGNWKRNIRSGAGCCLARESKSSFPTSPMRAVTWTTYTFLKKGRRVSLICTTSWCRCWFIGSVSEILDNLGVSKINNELPLEIFLTCKCYVHCSFKVILQIKYTFKICLFVFIVLQLFLLYACMPRKEFSTTDRNILATVKNFSKLGLACRLLRISLNFVQFKR